MAYAASCVVLGRSLRLQAACRHYQHATSYAKSSEFTLADMQPGRISHPKFHLHLHLSRSVGVMHKACPSIGRLVPHLDIHRIHDTAITTITVEFQTTCSPVAEAKEAADVGPASSCLGSLHILARLLKALDSSFQGISHVAQHMRSEGACG